MLGASSSPSWALVLQKTVGAKLVAKAGLKCRFGSSVLGGQALVLDIQSLLCLHLLDDAEQGGW